VDRLVRRFVQITVRFHYEYGVRRLLNFEAVGKPDLNAGALGIFLSGPPLTSEGRRDGPPHRSGNSGISFFIDQLCIEWMGETPNPQNLERSGSDIISER